MSFLQSSAARSLANGTVWIAHASTSGFSQAACTESIIRTMAKEAIKGPGRISPPVSLSPDLDRKARLDRGSVKACVAEMEVLPDRIVVSYISSVAYFRLTADDTNRSSDGC